MNNELMQKIIEKTMYGELDSDRHLITLFSIALASKGKLYLELGVREGHTTEPFYEAVKLNDGHLWSVDINDPLIHKPNDCYHTFCKSDSIQFLENWPKHKKIDVVFVDDWHSYPHVKRELELLSELVDLNGIILLHDLMYGNYQPYYHSDLNSEDPEWAEGGPYRAVAELDPKIWEWSTLPWNHGLTILRKKSN